MLAAQALNKRACLFELTYRGHVDPDRRTQISGLELELLQRLALASYQQASLTMTE